MDRRIVARWQDWSDKGIEHTVVTCAQKSNSADGVVIGAAEGQHFAVRYQIRCDSSWALEHACVQIVGEQRKVEFVSDGRGKWTDASGNRTRTFARKTKGFSGSDVSKYSWIGHSLDTGVQTDLRRFSNLVPLRERDARRLA
jgi:hypothetical protein